MLNLCDFLWFVFFTAVTKGSLVFFSTRGKFYFLLLLFFAIQIYICIVYQKKTSILVLPPRPPCFFFKDHFICINSCGTQMSVSKKSIPSLSSLESSKTRHATREELFESKRCPQMDLINHLTPTHTLSWLTPVADRASPSAGFIFGPLVL